MRVVIAGILGGIAMFVWASVAHMATPLARIGLSPMPGGQATLSQLHERLGDRPALYIFPEANGPGAMATGPSGLLAWRTPAASSFPRQLGVEFALEVVESILVAVLIVSAAGFSSRLRLALAIGLVAAITTNVSYWNWYGFDPAYTLATGFTELVKYLVAGLVGAWWLGRHERRARAFTDLRLGSA